MSRVRLTDDGTMDTVLRCDECGEEFRFNYEWSASDSTYEEWVTSCIEEIEQEHECEVSK